MTGHVSLYASAMQRVHLTQRVKQRRKATPTSIDWQSNDLAHRHTRSLSHPSLRAPRGRASAPCRGSRPRLPPAPGRPVVAEPDCSHPGGNQNTIRTRTRTRGRSGRVVWCDTTEIRALLKMRTGCSTGWFSTKHGVELRGQRVFALSSTLS